MEVFVSSGFLMPRIHLGSCLWSHTLRVSGSFVTVLAFACILVLCPIILRRVMLFLLRADVVGSGAGLSVVDLVYFVCVVGISLSVIRRW